MKSLTLLSHPEVTMAITKYTLRRPAFSSWADMDRISNRFAGIFDDPVFGVAPKERWSPALSVSENDDELLLTLELPGLGEEDITIEYENDVLRITGEKKEEVSQPGTNRKYHVYERRYGSFDRSFRLPNTVDSNGVVAAFEKGILSLTVPKLAEKKGRKIEISR